MGLSIYYSLKRKTDADGARDLVAKLRELVGGLSFDSVTKVLEWDPPDGKYAFQRADDDDQGRSLKAGDIYISRKQEGGETELVPVPALHSMCFFANVNGSETATFGLASHPPVVVHRETVISDDPDGMGTTHRLGAGDPVEVPTRLRGWYSWEVAVKTQYAGNPKLGGPANFLKAHLSIYGAVDAAKSLGFKTKISDDAAFEKDRNEKRLLEELAKYDEMIAGFAGRLTDALGDRNKIVAPIRDRPDFEHLEARGIARVEKKPKRKK